MTNPTCPQPGFTLPRRQFVTLNRLRCGQARCAESLYRWGVITSPACLCGESHDTTLLESAHSLHCLETCDVYTKRVLPQWNGCRDGQFNCESVPNEQQQHSPLLFIDRDINLQPIIAQQFRTVEVNLRKMLKNISPLLCEIVFNNTYAFLESVATNNLF